MPRHAIGRLFRLIQDPFGTFGELFLSHPYRNSKAPPRKFLTKDKGFIRVKVAYKFWRHAWYYLQFVGAKQVAKRIESNIFFLNAEVAKGIVVWKEFMALTKTCITEHHAVPLQMRFSFFFLFFIASSSPSPSPVPKIEPICPSLDLDSTCIFKIMFSLSIFSGRFFSSQNFAGPTPLDYLNKIWGW